MPEAQSLVPSVVCATGRSAASGFADVHALLLVRRGEFLRPFRPAELGGGIEQDPSERASVRREPGVEPESPVRELVEHDPSGPVPARQRDRRSGRVLPVEGLAGPVARTEARHHAEVMLGEPGTPPERADHSVDERRTGLEPGQGARRQGRLGEIHATTLRVTRHARRARRLGRVGRDRRGDGRAREERHGIAHATLRRDALPVHDGPHIDDLADDLATFMSDAVVELTNLSKRFSSTVLAVDDLSFAVDPGQVCGLLGPNGAGKTTALRMLLGLITPTAGEAYLFGHRVRQGAPELARVGALIETAAFVPHLSGKKNLELWWKAGGGRLADADFERALAIADLGDAITRRVKTYSQGMKQRLGLARVLLGRPDVLVLDEPTNGLDPGEMREVRLLVHRLADEGATVVFSSHILAEVEQICSHAIVMDRGHLVAAGAVADLVGASDSVYLEVDDLAAARRVLAAFPGVDRVEEDRPGLTAHLDDGATRAALVAALVHAGVGVETVTARRRLEDAFLGMVEADR